MKLAIRHQNAFMSGYERTKERKFMHYSNLEGILLVGEGDFSFSTVLVKAFGSAFNIIAISLDSMKEEGAAGKTHNSRKAHQKLYLLVNKRKGFFYISTVLSKHPGCLETSNKRLLGEAIRQINASIN